MAKKAEPASAALIAHLAQNPAERLVAAADGSFTLAGAAHASSVSAEIVRRHCASGLLIERAPGEFAAAPSASAWLKRRASAAHPFLSQHGDIGEKHFGGDGARVLVDLDESPLSSLARRTGKNGEPWLKPHQSEAAERLRRDFEIGRLQPRVTANWSASVSSGRRAGDGGGIPDLTDMALAARIRFDRAIEAIGPELSGVLVDVGCFLKGLETVERERRWPARSAKLVLRIALEALARHYGLTAIATGRSASRKVRHWGADDYRPEIS